MVILKYCVILHVLGKDTWKLIFLEFSLKNIHFWGVVILFFVFYGTKLGSGSRLFFFFFFLVAKFLPLGDQKKDFWETNPQSS